MATQFKQIVHKEIGTTPVEVLQMDTGFRCTVIGMNLVNITDSVATVNIYAVDSSSTAGYYGKNLIIPPDTSLKVITQGEKLIVPEEGSIRIESSIADSIDAAISYVEIT